MGWTTLPTSQTKAAQDDTEAYFDAVALNPGEISHVRITGDNNDATPSDDLEVKVYACLEDSTEEWDTIPFMTFVIAAADAAQNVDQLLSFQVSGVYKYRVGVASSGATDTWDVELDHREDGVNA